MMNMFSGMKGRRTNVADVIATSSTPPSALELRIMRLEREKLLLTAALQEIHGVVRLLSNTLLDRAPAAINKDEQQRVLDSYARSSRLLEAVYNGF